jgi:transposase
MMKSLPIEYRQRVIVLSEEGYTTSEIAEVLGTSPAWVRSIKALHRSGQPLAPRSRANKRRSLAERHGDAIRAQVKAKPGTTLEDLRRDLGLKTSISNLWNALRNLKLGLKKSPSGPPSGTGPTSPPPGRTGKSPPPDSTPTVSFSSTKPSARRR